MRLLDHEFKKRLEDYFDAHELVEYLQIRTEDIINTFEDEIMECEDDLEELMEIGVRK